MGDFFQVTDSAEQDEVTTAMRRLTSRRQPADGLVGVGLSHWSKPKRD